MKTKCTISELNSESENCGGEVYTHITVEGIEFSMLL